MFVWGFDVAMGRRSYPRAFGARLLTLLLRASQPVVDLVKQQEQTRHASGTIWKQCLLCFQRRNTAVPIGESKRAVSNESGDYVFEMTEIFFKLMMRHIAPM